MIHDKKPVHPVTLQEIDEEIKQRVSVASQELTDGFNLIKHQPKSVTFFGSARINEGTDYERARRLAGKLAKLGYSVITGGGPGMMEAANRGAFENHGRSIGLNIKLPHEQHPNPYITPVSPHQNPASSHTTTQKLHETITHEMSFYYFFTRKVMLSFSAEAYLFFPGGFGTFDELFEIVTLVQTKKIEPVPIFLVGTEFWNPVQTLIKDVLLDTYKTISPEDLSLYTITDDEDLIVETISKAPIRNGIRLHFKD